jgi:hypothetical protein
LKETSIDRYNMSSSGHGGLFHKPYLGLATIIIRKRKVEAEEKEFSENQFSTNPSIIFP